MDLIIALVPALLWGCTPIIVYFLGGKPIQQLLGTTYGIFILGIIIYLIYRPTITWWDIFWCVIAGIGWSVGQLTQYHCYNTLSVSTTSPITAGVQLIGVDLIGVFCFGNWAGHTAHIVGAIAVTLIILGVYISSRTGKNDKLKLSKAAAKKKTKNIILLIFGTGIGYTAFSTLPKIPNAQGPVTFPPSALGMLLGAIGLTLCFKKYRNVQIFKDPYVLKNIFEGLNSGLGTFFYMISFMINGVATAFTLSQMTPVIATFGGLVILHDHKRGKTLAYTLIGLSWIVFGGILTSFIR